MLTRARGFEPLHVQPVEPIDNPDDLTKS